MTKPDPPPKPSTAPDVTRALNIFVDDMQMIALLKPSALVALARYAHQLARRLRTGLDGHKDDDAPLSTEFERRRVQNAAKRLAMTIPQLSTDQQAMVAMVAEAFRVSTDEETQQLGDLIHAQSSADMEGVMQCARNIAARHRAHGTES
jgi:hypothetical protein